VLRLLVVTSARRLPTLPEIPTIAEAGVSGYEFTGCMGVLAPAETAPSVVVGLHRDLSRIAHLLEVKSRFAADAGDPVGIRPEEFAAYLRSEIAG
jgi:tripartite-type tricarboxylate transporter receptor subunit TctC